MLDEEEKTSDKFFTYFIDPSNLRGAPKSARWWDEFNKSRANIGPAFALILNAFLILLFRSIFGAGIEHPWYLPF